MHEIYIFLSKWSVYLSEIEKEFEKEFEKDPNPYRSKESLAQHTDSASWEYMESWFARKDWQTKMPF